MAEVDKTESNPEQEKPKSEGDENTEETGDIEGEEVEGEEGEEGAAPPNKKKKLILIALVVVIALGGLGAFFFLKNKKAAEDQAKIESDAPKAAEVIFHDLDPMIINLNTGSKNVSFMKLKVTVELGDSASLNAVEKMMPKIIDVFQLYLRELRPQDMQGSVGLYRLKEELLLRVNKIIMPNKVNDLLFKEVLVQ